LNINKNIALGLILGSGVDISESSISGKKVILEDTSGVHHKIIYTCRIAGKDAVIFKGRKHFYEGYTPDEITSNVRLAKELGVCNLLLTNAAGGLNENFAEGDIMMINSHINFIDKLKFRPDTQNYSSMLQEKFRIACSKMKVKLHEGTYGCYPGPNYETKAEIRFQKKTGLDAAGMSTVPEVSEANSLGINVLAVSVITNLLKENSISVTNHNQVLQTAKLASANLNKVLPVFISELN